MRAGRGNVEFRGLLNAREETAEHETRIENMILIGHVEEADYEAGKVRVRLDVSGDIITDWLPWRVPRAHRNCYWIAPEVGEQVEIYAWSGNLADAVVVPAINEEKWPHIAKSADVERVIYDVPENGVTDVFDHVFLDYRRDLKHRWWYGPLEDTRFRWQVGENDDGSNIIMDKDHIQLRVKKTQIVIRENSIEMHVNGKKVEFEISVDSDDTTKGRIFYHVQDKAMTEMTEDKVETSVEGKAVWRMKEDQVVTEVDGKGQHLVTAAKVESTVEGKSVLRVLKDSIEAELNQFQTRLVLAEKKLVAFVKTTWMKLTDLLAELRVAGSRVTAEPEVVTIESPRFDGIQAEAAPAEYEEAADAIVQGQEAPDDDDPHVTVDPPEVELGKAPYYPDEETREGGSSSVESSSSEE